MLKRALLVAVLCVLSMLGLGGRTTYAQGGWPPFVFEVTPTYADGRITYDLFFISLLDPGKMTDVAIIFPLPEGTQYLRGTAQPSTAVSFDGREVKFFTSLLADNAIPVASFTVETVDPAQQIFVTQPWLSWQGDPAGDYLADVVVADIAKPALTWSKPRLERLLLEADATVLNGVATFNIHPTNLGGRGIRCGGEPAGAGRRNAGVGRGPTAVHMVL